MDYDAFLAKYQQLWHITDGAAWPTLQRHGLLSAARLADLFGLDDAEELLSTRRAEQIVLEDPEIGRAVLRDQAPLVEKKLEAALTDGLTVADWVRKLNGLVFLYADRAARDKMLATYSGQDNLVLTLNARSLLDQYGVWFKVASINTGSTYYAPASRGNNTFLSVQRYDAKRPVREVVIDREIPDLLDHVSRVELHRADGSVERLVG